MSKQAVRASAAAGSTSLRATSSIRAFAAWQRVFLGLLIGTALATTLAQLPASASSTSSTSSGTDALQHNLRQRGAPHGSTAGTNLVDHGGLVLPASHIYEIWWGSSGFPPDAQSGMQAFFDGLNGSSYANTAAQYMHGAPLSITVSGSKSDNSAPPRKASPSTLGNEVAKEYGKGDPDGIYFVFTSNFPNGGNFCAWHSVASASGTKVAVAYMPNVAGIAGCSVPSAPKNIYSSATQALANVTAHEFMESITDTLITAWYDSSGSEIGDKCAWQFNGTVNLSSGPSWWLQEEWSNAATGCVQTTP